MASIYQRTEVEKGLYGFSSPDNRGQKLTLFGLGLTCLGYETRA